MKRKVKHQITFQDDRDALALALAKLGQSDKVIMREAELSEGQIQYRLRKAKDAENYAHGYRVQWRNGESDLCRRVKRDLLMIMKQDIKRDLPNLIGGV